jgi:hypothetical protein
MNLADMGRSVLRPYIRIKQERQPEAGATTALRLIGLI